MQSKKHAIYLSLIMLMSLSLLPPISFSSVDSTLGGSSVEQLTPAEIMPRNIRVAVYDEPNTTTPEWGWSGLYVNDSSDIAQVLSNAGYEVELVTFDDLLDHGLLVSEFDVFVLPDNMPRENVTMLAKSFWLSGGGLLTIDSSAQFLGYAGIIPSESEGDDGYGTYWTYSNSEIQVVNTLHPVTKGFSVGNEINITMLDWATFDWSAITPTTEGGHYVRLLHVDGIPNSVTGLAYEPELRGGRVVHLPGWAQNINEDRFIVEEMETLWVDAIEWLCPVPKSRVVFDLSHQPRLGFDPWDEYSSFPNYLVDFRDHLVTHSFTVDKLYPSDEGNLTADRLAPYEVLILVSPDFNYTAAEITAVEDWVDSGGSLLVLGESANVFGFSICADQLNNMVSPFGMQLNDSYLSGTHTLEPLYTPVRDRVDELTVSAVGYINLTGDAFPLIEKDGNVHGAAVEHGDGRMILMADMNWADMNRLDQVDNRDWALNLMNWLGSAAATTLLYCDDVVADDFYETPAAKALNELGIEFFLVTWRYNLNLTLETYDWEYVIVDAVNYVVGDSSTQLIEHVENGGYLAMATYAWSYSGFEDLLSMMGVAYADNYPSNDDFYIWDQNHPIYMNPVDLGSTSFEISGPYMDDGDLFHVFDNATALGGSSSLEQTNKCALAVRNDRKTIAMGYIFDQLDGDSDESGYADKDEIWLNVIAHLFGPTIDSPADVSYTEDETGNVITWNPDSYHPAEYIVSRNGTAITTEEWAGGSIEVSIDGLTAGNYSYTLTVVDWTGNEASDTVHVEVKEAASIIPPGLLDDPMLLLIVAGVLVLLIVVCIAKRKK